VSLSVYPPKYGYIDVKLAPGSRTTPDPNPRPIDPIRWRTPSIRASTVVRRLRADDPREVLSDKVDVEARAFVCPDCGRAEPDPVASLLDDRIVFTCPHCAGPEIRAAWAADAPDAYRCPNADCARGFHLDELRDGDIPTHDFPPPCRAVCPGSGQPPAVRTR
jgi:predicted RNA-binding Zn-ribbon protein involved in translation (DUF1610 family)